MTALAHHDEAGLDSVRLMDDLLGRMAQYNVSFEFNIFLLGAFAQRYEAFLVALLTVFKHCVKFRALGGFGRANYRDDEELGPHILSHRKRNIECVLCMRRRVERNQYSLNSNKHRTSHTLRLSFLCGYWPHDLLLCFLTCL